MLTKDNISLIIAIAGFVLSVFNIIRTEYFNKAKLKFTYRSHYCGQTVNFNFLIENCSRLDISISRMFLIAGNEEFEFRFLPKTVWSVTEQCGNTEVEKENIKSISLPQTIAGLGALGGYFSVQVSENVMDVLKDEANIAIKVMTNRGIFLFPFTTQKQHLDCV